MLNTQLVVKYIAINVEYAVILILAFVLNFWEYFFSLNHVRAIDYFYELFCNILLMVGGEHCCQKSYSVFIY